MTSTGSSSSTHGRDVRRHDQAELGDTGGRAASAARGRPDEPLQRWDQRAGEHTRPLRTRAARTTPSGRSRDLGRTRRLRRRGCRRAACPARRRGKSTSPAGPRRSFMRHRRRIMAQGWRRPAQARYSPSCRGGASTDYVQASRPGTGQVRSPPMISLPISRCDRPPPSSTPRASSMVPDGVRDVMRELAESFEDLSFEPEKFLRGAGWRDRRLHPMSRGGGEAAGWRWTITSPGCGPTETTRPFGW